MDSEKLYAGRDLLYLAFIFFGAGLGCFIHCFRKRAKRSFRDRCVTLGLIFFTGTVAVFAVMLILTRGKIITGLSFYATGIILAALAFFAARFPRAAGFPAIILTGLIITWIAYSFAQFPGFYNPKNGLTETNIGNLEFADGQCILKIIPEKNPALFIAEDSPPGAAQGPQFGITLTLFEYALFFPVIGGEQRGKITEFRNNQNIIYEDNRFEKGLLGKWINFLEKENPSGKNNFASVQKEFFLLPHNPVFSGSVTRIFYDGENISVH